MIVRCRLRVVIDEERYTLIGKAHLPALRQSVFGNGGGTANNYALFFFALSPRTQSCAGPPTV